MSALIGPLDTRVAVRRPNISINEEGEEVPSEDTSSWHGYDLQVDPTLSCVEIAALIGADYTVEVLPAVEVERPGLDADRPFPTRISILGGGNQIITALPEPDMTCPCPELDEELLSTLKDMDDDLKPDHWVLGRVGNDYRPIQNVDLCGLLDTFLTSCREYVVAHPESPLTPPQFETMGTLNNRRRFWAQVQLGSFGVAIMPSLDKSSTDNVHDSDAGYVDLYVALCVPRGGEDGNGGEDDEATASVKIQYSDEAKMYRLVSLEDNNNITVRSEAPAENAEETTPEYLLSYLDDAVTDQNDPRVEWLDTWSMSLRNNAEWTAVMSAPKKPAPVMDPITAYLLVTTSHDGKSLATVSVVFVRVVCNNTLGAAMDTEERVFSIKHVGDTSLKLKNAAAGLDWLAKTMRDEAARLSTYTETYLLDEEAHLLIGSFFGFGGKQGWLTERARKLWTGEDLLGAETAPAGTLYRLLNVLTQVIEESQGGKDGSKDGGDEAAKAAATARVSGEWRGRYSPTEANALCASVVANREGVLIEARKEASIEQRKQDEKAARQAELMTNALLILILTFLIVGVLQLNRIDDALRRRK